MNLYTLEPVSRYLRDSNSSYDFKPQTMKSQSLKGNFLANPYSEYEERKRRYNEEHQSYLSNAPVTKGYSSRTPEPAYNFPHIARDFSSELRVTKSIDLKSTPVSTAGKTELLSKPRERSNILMRQSLNSKPSPSHPAVMHQEIKPQSYVSKFHHYSETTKELLPIGRAPYRDLGQPVLDRNQFSEVAKTMLETPSVLKKSGPESSSFIAQERQTKDRQRDEMRRALDEQIEQKKAMQEEARRKKLIEDKIEQARVERQLKEIDHDIRREIEEGEMSKTFEDPPPTYTVPQKKRSKGPEPRTEISTNHINFKKRTTFDTKASQQSRFDAYRLRTQVEIQSTSIKDLIERLKDEQRKSKNYTKQAIADFEQMKSSLNFKHKPYADLKSRYQKSDPSEFLESSSLNTKRWHSSNSKFIPITHVTIEDPYHLEHNVTDLQLKAVSAETEGEEQVESANRKVEGGLEKKLREYEGVESEEARQLLSDLENMQFSLHE